MGSTVLRTLARQGHPADPTGLRTYREAAGANPCAQTTVVVSRGCRIPVHAGSAIRSAVIIPSASLGIVAADLTWEGMAANRVACRVARLGGSREPEARDREPPTQLRLSLLHREELRPVVVLPSCVGRVDL